MQLVCFYYKNHKLILRALYMLGATAKKFSFPGSLAPGIVEPRPRAHCSTAISSITEHCMLLTSAHSTQYQVSAIFFNDFGYSNAETKLPTHWSTYVNPPLTGLPYVNPPLTGLPYVNPPLTFLPYVKTPKELTW